MAFRQSSQEVTIKIGPEKVESNFLAFKPGFIVPIEKDGRTIARFRDGRVLEYDRGKNGFRLPVVTAQSNEQHDHFVSEWVETIRNWGGGNPESNRVLHDLLPLFYGARIFTEPRANIQDGRIDVLVLDCLVEELITGTSTFMKSVGEDHPQDLYLQKIVLDLVKLAKLEQGVPQPHRRHRHKKR